LCAVKRTTVAWQAANRSGGKPRLWQHLLTRVAHDPALSIVDSCPIPVCQFARAPPPAVTCAHTPPLARTCSCARPPYGRRLGHPPGSIVPGVQGRALGNRGYWKAGTICGLTARVLSVFASYKDK